MLPLYWKIFLTHLTNVFYKARKNKHQKDKLIGQGTSALGNLIDKNKKPGDSTKTVIPTTRDEVKEQVNTKVEEVKEKAKEEEFLQYGSCHKNLYLLLFEDL